MISKIKKIFYATDLTKNSVYTFQYAIEMSQRYGAKIILLHVIEPIPPSVVNYMKVYLGEGKLEEKIKYEEEVIIEEIKHRLNEFCKKEGQNGRPCFDLVSAILVRAGHPVEEILKAADEEECDLIILGKHGKGFLKHAFLGSVARSVLDRTHKPVFIVPLPHEEGSIKLDGI